MAAAHRIGGAWLALALAATPVLRAADTEGPGLAGLAAAADVVALAQVRDTDYRRQRDLPISGSAFLRVLISYKADRPADLLEVYEKGLHDHECYFPDRSVFEEGRRYLLFLRRDPEEPERYRGMPQGCALTVLVTADNGYAVRYPPDGIAVRDALHALAQPMRFADRYALVDDEDLPPAERNALQASGHIEAAGDGRWRYTHGIDLAAVRALIGPEAVENQRTRR